MILCSLEQRLQINSHLCINGLYINLYINLYIKDTAKAYFCYRHKLS